LEAAEAVTTLDGDLDVFGGLEQLVEQSLLRQDEQPDGEPRFFMLETVREFARERLDESGEEAEVSARHAGYLRDWVESIEPNLRGEFQVVLLRQVDVERDNLRVALGWTLRHDPETALRLANAQHWYWFLRGLVGEGRGWLERALAAPEMPPALRIPALNWSSFLAWNQGDLGVARARAEEALTLAETNGHGPGEGWALLNLGATARQGGNLEDASRLSGKAREVFQREGERWGGCLALYGLGMLARISGRINEARQLFAQALAEVEALADRAFGCFIRTVLAGVAFAQGDLDEAQTLNDVAQDDARELGFRLVEAQALQQLAAIAVARGDLDKAVALLQEAEAVYRDIGSRINIAYSRNDLGFIRLSQGDAAAAQALFEEALAIARDRGDPAAIALFQISEGDALSAQGSFPDAAIEYRTGLNAAQALGDVRTMTASLRGLASVALAEGHPVAATRLLAAEEDWRAPNRLQVYGYAAERRAQEREAAEAGLGEADFVKAWEEGTALSPQEAVSEALALAEEIAGEGSIANPTR
jgi:tetratricopeptide (TPR) repeat protein